MAKTDAHRTLMKELATSSSEFSAGMREISRNLDRSGGELRLSPQAGRPGKGRPSRAEKADPQLVAEAPFPELVTEPAHRLGSVISGISDAEVLARAHEFELRQGRRKSVLDRLEQRLGAIGHPLGGPEAPFENYGSLDPQEVIGRLQVAGPETAAVVYAYEHYHGRRRPIMTAAEELCGTEMARRAVAETSPRALIGNISEPFPGYDDLNASTEGRAAVREALSGLSVPELEKVRDYEQSTRRRSSMLGAIDVALNRARR